MPSSRDVALGRVAPRAVENGAVVSPHLQVNLLTLAQRQALNAQLRRRPLDREEAGRMFEADEVKEAFGDDRVAG